MTYGSRGPATLERASTTAFRDCGSPACHSNCRSLNLWPVIVMHLAKQDMGTGFMDFALAD